MTPIRPLIRILVAVGVAGTMAAGACSDSTTTPPKPPPDTTLPPDTAITTYTYVPVDTFPHDAGAFTQGLVHLDTVFIEGTGFRSGSSTLRRVDIETGTVLQIRDMPDPVSGGAFFGEGVAVWGDTIVQLSWVKHEAIIYDLDSFDEIGRFTYPTEGWGLTHDGSRFIMSDGTDTLYFRDKDTFDEIGRVAVVDENGPVDQLNELEYIDGLVYANRYTTRLVVMIDPETGRVRGRFRLNMTDHTSAHVANGIAYDAPNDRLFVTGKLWSNLYEIELIEESAE
jgi:glutamine cyclotransferase